MLCKNSFFHTWEMWEVSAKNPRMETSLFHKIPQHILDSYKENGEAPIKGYVVYQERRCLRCGLRQFKSEKVGL